MQGGGLTTFRVADNIIDPRSRPVPMVAEGSLLQMVQSARKQGYIDPSLINENGQPLLPDWQVFAVVAKPNSNLPPAYFKTEQWADVTPKPGMAIVLTVRPGKGGGGKNPMRVLLSIAVVVAAWYFAPQIAATIAPEAAAVSGAVAEAGGAVAAGFTAEAAAAAASTMSLTTSIVSAGLTMVGNLAVNSLMPAPRPDMSRLSGNSASAEQSPHYQVTGVSNQATPFGVVPLCMGAPRVWPKKAAPSLFEVVGDTIYVRELFDFGYGPADLSVMRIGSTPLEEFEDYEIQVFNNFDPDVDVVSLYPDTPYVEAINRDLPYNERVIITTNEAEEVIPEVSFPGGLVTYDNSANPQYAMAQFKIEYRLQGTTEWTTVTTTTQSPQDAAHFDEAWYYASDPDAARWGPLYGGFNHWVKDGRKRPARWKESSIHEYGGSKPEAQIRASRIKLPARGIYEIGITRLTPESTESRTRNAARISVIKSMLPGTPVKRRGAVLVALRLKSGKDFNGRVESFNAICERSVNVYDEQTQAWSLQKTTNPAWLALDCLIGPANKRARSIDGHVDVDAWVAFAQHCDQIDPVTGLKKFSYSHVIDYRTSVTQKADAICVTARGRLIKIGNKWSVIFDAPMTGPTDYISAESSWGFSRKITYVKLPHALRVRYQNKDRAWREVIVYDDGYDKTTATVFELIELEGCETDEQAWREGVYWFNTSKCRRATTTLHQDIEYLSIAPGSLVGVNHPVPRWGKGSALIKEVFLNEDGDVARIRVDTPLSMEAGKDYAARIQYVDRRTVYEQVQTVAGDNFELIFAAPIPAINIPRRDDRVMFGELGFETTNLLVKRIHPKGRDSAMIEFVDEAPQIHNADVVPMPEGVVSVIAERLPAPYVTSLSLSEVVSFQAGQPFSKVVASWQPGDGPLTKAYEIYRFDGYAWRLSAVVDDTKYETSDVRVGENFQLLVVAVSPSGESLPFGKSPMASLVLVGDVGAPPKVEGFLVTRLEDGLRRFTCSTANWPEDVRNGGGVLVRYSHDLDATWDDMVSLSNGVLSVLPFDVRLDLTGAVNFAARLVDNSGNYSEEAAYITATIDDPRSRSHLASSFEHELNWSGQITNGYKVDGVLRAVSDGGWDTLPDTWDGLPDTWDTILPAKTLVYETGWLDVGRVLRFTPTVNTQGKGGVSVDVAVAGEVTWDDLPNTWDGLGGAWADITGDAVYNPIAGAVHGRFFKVRISVSGASPELSALTVHADAIVETESYEDVDTATENRWWFESIGVGHFRVATLGAIGLLTTPSIRAIQGAGQGWTSRLISKNAVVSGNPAAEFQIYDATGALADAVVDIELKGVAI